MAVVYYSRSGQAVAREIARTFNARIAYRAIQNGFDAHCTTAAALIEDLSVAGREGRLR